MRLLLPVAVSVVALALTACGSSTSSSASAGASNPPSATSSRTASASSTPSPSSDTKAPAGSVDAAALCDFLRAELPAITSVGSKVGAQAQFAIAFYEWGEPRGLSGATQQQFDDAAKSACPDVRDRIAAATGQTGLLS